MNTPAFVFNAAAPPNPFGGAPINIPHGTAPTTPGKNDTWMTTAPVAPPNWNEKAQALIREKVLVDGNPINTPQILVWAYNKIKERMGGGDNIDQRICEGLEKTPVGAVNLGNEVEVMTFAQHQAAITALIPTKLTFKGAPCAGNEEYMKQILGWLWTTLPTVNALTDNDQRIAALHKWMQAIVGTYELDDATRAQAVQTPPPNPVSDQTTAQVAQPAVIAPIKPEGGEDEGEPEGEGLLDPVDGYKCKNLRGLKTRATRTHKADWGPFCTQHGLDPLTGKKAGPGIIKTAPIAPSSQPPVSEPLPALIGQGAPVNAAAVPTNALYDANGQPTPAYAAAQRAAAAVLPLDQMPTPPAQQPSSPVTFTPTFQPVQHAPPQNTPLQPASIQNTGYVAPPAVYPAGIAPQNTPIQPAPHLALAVGYVVPQIAPTQPLQPQPQKTNITTGLNRAQLAQALGGEVRLIVCRLLEVNNVNLTGYTDVNQLSLLAEKLAREEMRIVDLAQAQYGAGKQTAQRLFAELLTKYPACYMLMNGFEPILTAGYLDILIARTTYVYHVSERGGNIEIKF